MERNCVTAYAAFLRGINVGGHKLVPMRELSKAFASLGFKNVRTLLASGNVVFEATGGAAAVKLKIEKKVREVFGFEIGVIIRTMAELERLRASNPFKGIPVTPHTKLYVTFLSEKPGENLRLPYRSPDGNFRILPASSSEVYSVVTPAPGTRSVDMMLVLERQFGQNITTRNWQTVLRVLNAHQPASKDSSIETSRRARKR
jgi:uncharacterized protein (DUF1697 family)